MANGRLHIVTWNVAHGSAVFINTPNNRTILVDAGRSDDFSPAEHLHSNYGIRSVDQLILSHADADHLRDLPNIWRLLPPATFSRNRTAPRRLIFPTDPPDVEPLKTYDVFDGYYSGPLPSTDEIGLPANWGGVWIQLFFNSEVNQFDCLNDYSLVTVLRFGPLRFVFPGDLEAPGWRTLMLRPDFLAAVTPNLTDGNEVRVLVAPHHGHSAGVYQPFLDYFRPRLTLISGAYGDPFTDTAAYDAASSGLFVYQRATAQFTVKNVLTTKVNDFVLVEVLDSAVVVSV